MIHAWVDGSVTDADKLMDESQEEGSQSLLGGKEASSLHVGSSYDS